jgi:hypothetical protein
MKTMEDAVLEHSKKDIHNTTEAMDLLGLPPSRRENIGAANLYWTALRIIKELNVPSKGTR